MELSKIKNDWDWVSYFEETLAEYCGSKYAVACDSNSNAIRLLLNYLEIKDQELIIPSRTYVSVPNQIILSGNRPKFVDYEWDGSYKIGNTSIIDAATMLKKGMYTEGSYTVLSFHFKKILNIGKGGMILTNNASFVEWARPMLYDGRHKDKMYVDDDFECIGWHMYMTPEDAKKGIEIFNSGKIKDSNPNVGSSKTYKDLRRQKIFSSYI